MKTLFLSLLATATLASGSVLYPRAACAGNTATTRNEWCDFNIDTNYYNEVPDTGVVRSYNFTLQQIIASPDGVPRVAYAINGQIPGPTIVADWGDTVEVTVTNELHVAKNGTSIHFHGIRQNHTSEMDGVVAITQCPTAPGKSITYRWRATQYGSSWYHSHLGFQAWDGVAGGIIINGPATANYDVDKGTILLSDWNHRTSDELYATVLTEGPPTTPNGLLNGTNTYSDDGTTTVGHRFNTSVVEGQSYRFRLINGAMDSHFAFSIDNHTMTVIAADFVPIIPYNTTTLQIAMGQRYDIIVHADQKSTADNFWMRAIPETGCSAGNTNVDNIRGILSYGDAPGIPTTTQQPRSSAACQDELVSNLVPRVPLSAGISHWTDLEIASTVQDGNAFLWALNNTSFYVNWEQPTLLQVYNNQTNFTERNIVIELNEPDKWFYLIIETQLTIPHPLHLHGHDFWILGQGSGTYDSSKLLSLVNPMRRDVALVPGGGFLVIGFISDNPGVWLTHCHIGWHTGMGFALQFVEQREATRQVTDLTLLDDTCRDWNAYALANDVHQHVHDSGI